MQERTWYGVIWSLKWLHAIGSLGEGFITHSVRVSGLDKEGHIASILNVNCLKLALFKQLWNLIEVPS